MQYCTLKFSSLNISVICISITFTSFATERQGKHLPDHVQLPSFSPSCLLPISFSEVRDALTDPDHWNKIS